MGSGNHFYEHGKRGDFFGWFISQLLSKGFRFDQESLPAGHTKILIAFILIFMIISASIVLGLFSGLLTIGLINFFELSHLSIYPQMSPKSKIIISSWIILFAVYYSRAVGRLNGKTVRGNLLIITMMGIPFAIAVAFFACLIAVGILSGP